MNENPALNQKSFLKIILLTTLIAGTLDILSAIVNTYFRTGKGPEIIFKFIASGVFGDDAFSGGAFIVTAGIFFHYFIAFSWTLIFFILYPKINLPSKYKIIAGLCYGIIVWLIMNLIIVPLSRTPETTFTFKGVLLGALFLMFFIGLPISLMYHRYHRNLKMKI